jgi:hypothetical protein
MGDVQRPATGAPGGAGLRSEVAVDVEQQGEKSGVGEQVEAHVEALSWRATRKGSPSARRDQARSGGFVV